MLIAPTPVRPRTSLDDMMAELLRPPQPPAPAQVQPPPTFIPLIFRPDARARPRSASPTLITEPIRPFTVPLAEHFITRDLGRRRPSRAGRLPRPGAPALSHPLHPLETQVTRPDRRVRLGDTGTGPDFLDGVHHIRGQRPPHRDGWIDTTQDAEPGAAPVSLILAFLPSARLCTM